MKKMKKKSWQKGVVYDNITKLSGGEPLEGIWEKPQDGIKQRCFKKVVDKAEMVWYNNQAVNERRENKNRKRSKKVLDKRLKAWYNVKVPHNVRNDSEPWKLNSMNASKRLLC